MVAIQYNARKVKLTSATKAFIKEKVSKHGRLLEQATSIEVTVLRNPSDHGDTRNFKVEISVHMPQTFIRVEGKGREIETIVDKLEPTLKRRLKRYHDLYRRWEKEEPWKVVEYQESLPELEHSVRSYADFNPVIKRKSFEDNSPIHPAEAIERMELLGHDSFLFRNIESSNYAMVYRRKSGGYGLVEPKV